MAEAQNSFTGEVDSGPSKIPATAADVFTETVHVTLITLNNIGAATATVTVADKQSTALAMLTAIEVDVGTPQIWRCPEGRKCPGGVTWVASAADTVVGYIRAKK